MKCFICKKEIRQREATCCQTRYSFFTTTTLGSKEQPIKYTCRESALTLPADILAECTATIIGYRDYKEKTEQIKATLTENALKFLKKHEVEAEKYVNEMDFNFYFVSRTHNVLVDSYNLLMLRMALVLSAYEEAGIDTKVELISGYYYDTVRAKEWYEQNKEAVDDWLETIEGKSANKNSTGAIDFYSRAVRYGLPNM